jgi:membrane dipeptidase
MLAILPVLTQGAGPGARDHDRQRNRVVGAPRLVSDRAHRLHARSRVVDLHADTLLWGRDLNRRATHGHVDVPRLIEGNVAVQVFSVVTQVTIAGEDGVAQLAETQGWPRATRTSLLERALYQAGRLRAAAAASGGRLVVIRSRADLDDMLARRGRGEKVVGGVLSLEGAQALGTDPSALDTLFAAGFRMIGLTHFADNAFAGSAQGRRRGGLTERGRDLVRHMEARGVIVDLAHASPRTIDDVLAIASRPVVVSHTGVRATCDGPRNLTDAQLAAIAHRGGVVGIGYWQGATCGQDTAAIVRAIRHAMLVAGADHVALGSDFDGLVATPFDSARLAEVSDALLAAGVSEGDLTAILGENALRVLRTTLP